MHFEKAYKNLIKTILFEGEHSATRNAVTVSTFGEVLKINSLRRGEFPLVTGRKMFPLGIIGEMAAFLNGPKQLSDFEDRGCKYWKKWADKDGKLTLDYGNAWLDWNGINQLEEVAETIRTNPKDRRMIITGWDPSQLKRLSLPCCHILYQFHVDNSGYLNMIWYQRSADVMIGVPSDIVLGALMIILMANSTGLKPGTLTMFFGDTHIYESHKMEADTYLHTQIHKLPTYKCDGDITHFEPHNIRIDGYTSGPKLEFELHG